MWRKMLLWLLVGWGLPVSSAWAAGIEDAGTYVYVDVSVRSLTLQGMRTRLALLQGDRSDPALEAAIDADTQRQVAEFYQRFGTSAAAHAAYGSREAVRIRDWIDAHPLWQQRYADLEADFRAVSAQLNGLR
jgi:hypothetical protein